LTKHATTECLLFPDIFDRPVVASFGHQQGSSNGGAILLKTPDLRLGLTSALAACLKDERQPGKGLHELGELLMQRSPGFALGYEAANDAARLASDPVHKLLVGRARSTVRISPRSPRGRALKTPPNSRICFARARHWPTASSSAIGSGCTVVPAGSPSIWIPLTIRRTATSSSLFLIRVTPRPLSSLGDFQAHTTTPEVWPLPASDP